jgi:hypothetical protein
VVVADGLNRRRRPDNDAYDDGMVTSGVYPRADTLAGRFSYQTSNLRARFLETCLEL